MTLATLLKESAECNEWALTPEEIIDLQIRYWAAFPQADEVAFHRALRHFNKEKVQRHLDELVQEGLVEKRALPDGQIDYQLI